MRFQADPGTIRMIMDYPFDAGDRFPADDVRRVHELKGQLGEENTIVWLPHFLSEDRKADLSTLIVINYLLERDRLTQVTPNLTTEDRYHAKTQLESRRSALTAPLDCRAHRDRAQRGRVRSRHRRRRGPRPVTDASAREAGPLGGLHPTLA